jgi:hypothetical protein
MDEMRTGVIKTDVFYSVLKITNIKLSQETQNELNKLLNKEGMINYKDALARISCNTNDRTPLNNDWMIRSAHSSMRSSVYTSPDGRVQALPTHENIMQFEKESEMQSNGERSVKLSGNNAHEYNSQFSKSQNRIINR